MPIGFNFLFLEEVQFKKRAMKETVKINIKVTEVQSIKPESDVMKQLIDNGVQRVILDKAMGIDELEASLDCT